MDQMQSTWIHFIGGSLATVEIVVTNRAVVRFVPTTGTSSDRTISGTFAACSSSTGTGALGSHRAARVCSNRWVTNAYAAVAFKLHSVRYIATL